MRIKFLHGIADATGGFEPGQIVEMPDDQAVYFIRKKLQDGTPLAIEVKPTECPNCGHVIVEPQGPSGALEAATIASTPRRR